MALELLLFSISMYVSRMACGYRLLVFLVMLIEFVISTKLQLAAAIGQVPQVPCYFVFGDSLVDNGNNNLLITQGKANYKPYGIDFANGIPTGRFTNRRNLADFIGMVLPHSC